MSEPNPTTDESQSLDEHRALVRELDRSFASVYGYGGMGVIAFAAVPVVTAYWQGWLTNPGTWVVAITFGLIGLYPLRGIVNRKRQQLADRFRSYCELNDVDPAAIRSHFKADGGYPYFLSLFEAPSGATASTEES